MARPESRSYLAMSPSLSEAAATFLAVLPAELPDKTILATLILSSRYRPWYVFTGAAAAFLAQVVIGVAAGGAISLLPHRPVEAAAAGAFAVGAVLLWRHKEEVVEGEGGEGGKKRTDADDEGGQDGMRDGFWPVFGTSFAVVFLAEFGDLTQFMTVSLAARFHNPVAVGVGATLALWTAAGLAVLVGWRLLKLIPMHWLTRGAAVIMLILAGTSLYAALR
jgi:putative Ca2+/H+ antiporter (TMEM165/GDT1 family)